jgi:hypothetical protein
MSYITDLGYDTSTFFLEAARGNIPGVQTVHKFGSNPNVGGTEEDVWAAGGKYNWMQGAEQLRIFSSDAADQSAGTGCRSIKVIGLDADFSQVSSVVALSGTSTVTSTATMVRVVRAYAETVGTYTGSNIGNLTVASPTYGNVAYIEAARGQTQLSMYTVPKNKTAALVDFIVNVGVSNKSCDVGFWQRQLADDVTAPFTSQRLVTFFRGLDGSPAAINFESPPLFPEKTDLWATGQFPSGSGAAVDVTYELVLFDD